jgi:hypothetical protein
MNGCAAGDTSIRGTVKVACGLIDGWTGLLNAFTTWRASLT